MESIPVRPIIARPLTDEAFAPYGVVIRPTADGTPAGAIDHALDLSQGRPRFYILALEGRPLRVKGITRHHQTTQVLASVGGAEWLMVLAPPGPESNTPDIGETRAFQIPGDVAVLLYRGTWHAGPYFVGPSSSFFNLELEDTNIVDHYTCMLPSTFGFAFDLQVLE